MKLFENKSLAQFIKFAVVGASGTVIDWVLYFLFTRSLGIYYLIAKIISFVIAALNNYIWNRVWTFKSKEKKVIGEFIKFFVVSIVGLGLNTLIMYLTVGLLGWKDFYALVLATAIVMIWNFFANKFHIFWR